MISGKMFMAGFDGFEPVEESSLPEGSTLS